MFTFIPLSVARRMLSQSRFKVGPGIRADQAMERWGELTDHQRANLARIVQFRVSAELRQIPEPAPTLYPIGAVITDHGTFTDGCTISG